MSKKKPTNEIVPIDEAELNHQTIMSLVKAKNGSQQDQFYLYYFFNLPIKTCAKLAGYTEAYGYKLVQKLKHSPAKQKRVEELLNIFPEQYKLACKARFIDLAEIEGQALDEYRKDPKLYIKHPQVAKQIKQGAGVLANEEERPVPQLNIRSLQQLSLTILNTPPEEFNTEQITDAEIIEGQD